MFCIFGVVGVLGVELFLGDSFRVRGVGVVALDKFLE